MFFTVFVCLGCSPGLHVAFIRLLLWSWKLFSCSLSLMPDTTTFELLWLLIWLIWYLPTIKCSFRTDTTEMMPCPSQRIMSENIWCPSVLLLIVTLIIWLRWLSAEFSTVFYHLLLIIPWGEILRGYADITLVILLTSNVSTYWQFPPVKSITVLSAWRWFPVPVISSVFVNWNSIKTSCSFAHIYLLTYIFKPVRTSGYLFIPVIIGHYCLLAQIVPDVATG